MELDREHRSVLDPRQVAQATESARIVQAHAAVRKPRGNDPAGRVDGERGRVVHLPRWLEWACLERACEAAVSGDVPDDDPAVQPAGVERAPVVVDHEVGDGTCVAGQGLAHLAGAHVPDQHPAVVASGRKGAAIRAELQPVDPILVPA